MMFQGEIFGRAARNAVGALALAVGMLATPVVSNGPALAQTAAAPQAGTEPLDIVTGTGPHHFDVEVMRTEAEREKGLMFRRFMPADRGMLFDFKAEAPIMMWMKNTYLPLDMVFISHSGTVTGVAENAEPMSERIIPSGGPVYAVLEVNAGTVAKIGLKPGDHIRNELFGK